MSHSAYTPEQLEDMLGRHRKKWHEKKILRIIYSEWYQMILKDLSPVSGPTVELGGGGGNFKEFKPDVITSDIEPHPWIDLVFDAHQMPFQAGEVSNLVMVDVLHHLSNPVHFLEEAYRVLQPGGRLIMLEPYPSPFSLPIYRKFHPEPFIMDVDYFSKTGIDQKDPWDANQAIPYLLFYRDRKKFEERFKGRLQIKQQNRLSCLLYPASGGFENKSFIPDGLIPLFQFAEKMLTPVRSLLAFRCYVVLEKKAN
ncbi:class I SAM-dependent methyltransferase [Siphonobacter sp.]|uniref:class I SAM-dependent methyltransferase n=1 Tax=Siphonobacter sp. TaxID=1869184 RepID=UPI003B3B1178